MLDTFQSLEMSLDTIQFPPVSEHTLKLHCHLFFYATAILLGIIIFCILCLAFVLIFQCVGCHVLSPPILHISDVMNYLDIFIPVASFLIYEHGIMSFNLIIHFPFRVQLFLV